MVTLVLSSNKKSHFNPWHSKNITLVEKMFEWIEKLLPQKMECFM